LFLLPSKLLVLQVPKFCNNFGFGGQKLSSSLCSVDDTVNGPVASYPQLIAVFVSLISCAFYPIISWYYCCVWVYPYTMSYLFSSYGPTFDLRK
jgi:hypothetical protein